MLNTPLLISLNNCLIFLIQETSPCQQVVIPSLIYSQKYIIYVYIMHKIYFKNFFFVCIYLFLSWSIKKISVVIISIYYYKSDNVLLIMKFTKYIYPCAIIFLL